MKDSLQTTPHRRYNLLTGEWVLVSPHRTKRPWQGKKDKVPPAPQASYDPHCYLCPGNTRASGATNPDYQGTYAFTNDFAALLPDTEPVEITDGLLRARTEPGICRVICFSEDHSLTLPRMEISAIREVVECWCREYESLGGKEFINHVQIFENKGALMGCSNPHPHGQIWAQHTLPGEARKKQAQQLQHWEKTGRSLLGDYLAQELAAGERILLENEHFVALVPYWAFWPYETMVIPRRHQGRITDMEPAEKTAFAEIIKALTIRYDNLFEVSFPYSSGIHQAPTDGQAHSEWHFHMAFYPPLLRSAEVKKFMVGYEMFADPQRDISPEQAAATLRGLSSVHYTQTP